MNISTLTAKIENSIRRTGEDPIILLDKLLTYIVTRLSVNDNLKDFLEIDRITHVDIYNDILQTYLSFMDEKLKETFWYDAWGDIFMDFSGKYKSCRGQFFTPQGMANLSARCLTEENKQRKFVNDCACGSARMLLAYQQSSFENHHEQPYLIGEDIDFICCKMAAVNLCIHGCRGEIILHDSLNQPQSLKMGFLINEKIIQTGQPSIRMSVNSKDFAKFTLL